MQEMIMIMLLKLQSTFNTTDITNPQNLKPQKIKGSVRPQENISFFGTYKSPE